MRNTVVSSFQVTEMLSVISSLENFYRILTIFNKFENGDTKEVIRICKSKDRQHNSQKKKYKRKNNDLQNIHIKQKIEKHEPH